MTARSRTRVFALGHDRRSIDQEAASAPTLGQHDTDEPRTAYQSVITHNNFYKFGVNKDEPAQHIDGRAAAAMRERVDYVLANGGVSGTSGVARWAPGADGGKHY
jgi:hypothetical protein